MLIGSLYFCMEPIDEDICDIGCKDCSLEKGLYLLGREKMFCCGGKSLFYILMMRKLNMRMKNSYGLLNTFKKFPAWL